MPTGAKTSITDDAKLIKTALWCSGDVLVVALGCRMEHYWGHLGRVLAARRQALEVEAQAADGADGRSVLPQCANNRLLHRAQRPQREPCTQSRASLSQLTASKAVFVGEPAEH